MNSDGIKGVVIGVACCSGLLFCGCAGSLRPAELPRTERPLYKEDSEPVGKLKDIGRVVELRGEEGELARVLLGYRQGAAVGVQVEFFVYEDYSDVLAEAEYQPSPVGYGLITETEDRLSWVKISAPERGVIRRGHYVRIAPRQPQSPIDKIKGLFSRKERSPADKTSTSTDAE